MDARRRRGAGGAVDCAQRQDAHGPLPAPIGNRNLSERPAVGLEELELRQAALVGDEGDPLAVGRPPRLEGVVLEEGQLVRLAARRRLHVQVVELVCRATR
jgi:hypothetical protein